MTQYDLRVRIDGRQAEQGASQIGRSFDDLGKKAQGVGRGVSTAESSMKSMMRSAMAMAAPLAALFSLREVTRFGRESLVAYEQLAAGERALALAVESSGVSFAASEAQIKEHQAALWETHRLTGGEFNDVLRRLIATTGDYDKSLAQVGLTADLAAGLQVDAATAAKMMGRVLEGDVGVLKRYGLQATDSAHALELMQERFGGMAKESLTGSQLAAKAFGDLKEEIGRVLVQAGGGVSIFETLTDVIRSATEWINKHSESLGKWGAMLVRGIVAPIGLAVNAVQILTGTILGTVSGMVGGVLKMLNKVGLGPDASEFLAYSAAAWGGVKRDIEDVGRIIAGIVAPIESVDRKSRVAAEGVGEMADAVAGAGRSLREFAGRTDDIDRLGKAIASTGESIKDLEFRLAFEDGADAAKKLTEELARQEQQMVRLTAARDAYLKSVAEGFALERRTPGVRSILTQGTEAISLPPLRVETKEVEDAITRGFRSGSDALKETLARAFSAESVGQGIGQSIGAGIAGLAVSLVGSTRDSFANYSRQVGQNREAVERLTRTLDEWGDRVMQMSAADVARFSGAMAVNGVITSDQRNSGATRELERLMGFDFGDRVDPGEWEELHARWVAVMEAARDKVAQILATRMAEGRAELAGDDVAKAEIRERAKLDEAVAWANEQLRKGLITTAEAFEYVELSAALFAKRMGEVREANERAAEAARLARDAFDADVGARALAAAGMTDEYEARRREIAQRQEMLRAVEEFGEEVRPMLEALHEIENVAAEFAAVLREMDAAIAAAAETAREAAAAFDAASRANAGLAQRMFALAGDDVGAFDARQATELTDATRSGLPPATLAWMEGVQRAERDRFLAERAWREQQGLQSAQDSQESQDQGQTLQDLLRTAQGALREQERQVAATEKLLDSLRKFGQSLLLSNLSPLTPEQQYYEARSQMEAMVELARGGDQTAAASLPDSIRAFLEASRAVNALPQYTDDFDWARKVLAEITSQYADQLTHEQAVLAEMATHTSLLERQVEEARNAGRTASDHLQATQSFSYEMSQAMKDELAQLKADALVAEEILAELKRQAEEKLTAAQKARDDVWIEQRDILRDMYDLWAGRLYAQDPPAPDPEREPWAPPPPGDLGAGTTSDGAGDIVDAIEDQNELLAEQNALLVQLIRTTEYVGAQTVDATLQVVDAVEDGSDGADLNAELLKL